jgi:hypothetical protein
LEFCNNAIKITSRPIYELCNAMKVATKRSDTPLRQWNLEFSIAKSFFLL